MRCCHHCFNQSLKSFFGVNQSLFGLLCLRFRTPFQVQLWRQIHHCQYQKLWKLRATFYQSIGHFYPWWEWRILCTKWFRYCLHQLIWIICQLLHHWESNRRFLSILFSVHPCLTFRSYLRPLSRKSYRYLPFLFLTSSVKRSKPILLVGVD